MATYYSYVGPPILSPQWKEQQRKTLTRFIHSPVPKPRRSYPLSKSRSKKWIDEAQSQTEKTNRQHFVDSIVHISFEQFLKALCACTCALKKNLAGKDWVLNLATEKSYQKHKSSEWVANLMIEDCKMPLPLMIQSSFWPKEMDELWQLANLYYTETKSYLPLVLADDVSYSGTQIQDTLKHFFHYLNRKITKTTQEVPIHLHILLPFIASKTENSFGRLFSDLPQNCHAISSADTCDGQVFLIETVFDRKRPELSGGDWMWLDNMQEELFDDKNYNKYTNPQYFPKMPIPVTFYTTHVFDDFEHHSPSVQEVANEEIGHFSRVYTDHKLPDYVSVPYNLMAPLIEGCEYEYSPGKPIDQHPNCPPPPYKPFFQDLQ